jgi:hypothetical protein
VAGLSIFDSIYLGIDENGHPVYLNLVGRNLLVGGEPGSGKSVLRAAAMAAMSQRAPATDTSDGWKVLRTLYQHGQHPPQLPQH